MAQVNFIPAIRTDAINKAGTVPIVIKAYLNNVEVAHPSLKKRIFPVDWDEAKRCVKNSNTNGSLLNGIITNKVNQYDNFILKRQTLGLPINKTILLKYLKSENAVDDFYEFAEDVFQKRTLADGKCLDEDTKRRYRDEIRRMKLYKENLTFKQLDINFLNAYKLWLQNDHKKKDGKPLHKNSIWKAFGVIRMIYNEAVKDTVSPESNPFKVFKVGSFETDIDKIKYLELNEINLLEKVLNEKQMPEQTCRIGWRFLAMCVCGMRISDAMTLDELTFNDAGDLEFKPFKTRRHNNVAHIPLTTERQRRYLQTTLSLPITYTNHKSFRTTFNIHLKVLAALAGISINITSHVGRHSMGSFLVDAGVEQKAAMKMLGIKDPKTIQTYLHLKQSKLKSEADKMGNVM